VYRAFNFTFACGIPVTSRASERARPARRFESPRALSSAPIAKGDDHRFGGNGRHGKVRLFSSQTAGGGFTDDAATIVLAGDNGSIKADGAISATAFRANGTLLNVPDYVWDAAYEVMPLTELRAYTVREKRLPNVPSAAEIHREGVDLSQFQMLLLEKVEELTRYLLAQEEMLQAQRAQIAELEREVKLIRG
jgi:hypothetical protein